MSENTYRRTQGALTPAEYRQILDATKKPRKKIGDGDSKTITITLPTDVIDYFDCNGVNGIPSRRNKKIVEALEAYILSKD